MPTYVLALAQGTTSSRAILFDAEGNACAQASQEIAQIYPQPGWVEHDPVELWDSLRTVAAQVLHERRIPPGEIRAIGLSN